MNLNQQETPPVAPSRRRPLSSSGKEMSTHKKPAIDKSLPIPKLQQEALEMANTTDSKLELILSKLEKLDVIEVDIKDMKSTIDDFKSSLDFTQTQLSEACEEILQLKHEVESIKIVEGEVRALRLKVAELEQKSLAQDMYSRRENIIIDGLKESKDENCFDVAQALFKTLGLGPYQLQRCHRLGRPGNRTDARPRPLIVRFAFHPDKGHVMSRGKKLKGTDIYMRDDYPSEIETRRAALRPILKMAKKEDPRAALIQDKIRFKEKLFSIDTIKTMPLDLSGLGNKETDKYILFAGQFSALSNFYPCTIEHDGISFPSSEHLFQFMKCNMLKRPDLAAQVLSATSPWQAMMKGRECKSDVEWEVTSGKMIMTEVVDIKAQQVLSFKDAIQTKAGKMFAEATTNKVWGTGIPLASQSATDESKWQGKNLLGTILSELSMKLK